MSPVCSDLTAGGEEGGRGFLRWGEWRACSLSPAWHGGPASAGGELWGGSWAGRAQLFVPPASPRAAARVPSLWVQLLRRSLFWVSALSFASLLMCP